MSISSCPLFPAFLPAALANLGKISQQGLGMEGKRLSGIKIRFPPTPQKPKSAKNNSPPKAGRGVPGREGGRSV